MRFEIPRLSLIGVNVSTLKLLVLLGVSLFIVVFYLAAKRYKLVRKPFIVFSILAQIVYILWRILYTVPFGNPIGVAVGIILIAAEALGAFQAAMHRILYLKEPLRAKGEVPPMEALPSVDVLICVYNEPAKIIEKTVAAAVSLAYPKDRLHVYVCDDGKRNEVARIAQKFGAQWVTRPDNSHAKAGNLNNCLKNVARSEFFLVLDADVVVRSQFLMRTIGCFDTDKIAFVQAPQVFYTPDPFQYNLYYRDSIPNEQDYFMREIQPRRAAYDATLFVGSNGLFRRSCIDEIGLIPTESITEDIATSLVLQSHGYSGVTVDEVLAVGLSAESFADYVTQHDRWGRGNIQVLKRYKPLTCKGLSPIQRLLYFDGIIYWFFGLQKIIYIVCPVFYLLTGIPIFYSDILTMMIMYFPTFLLSMLIIRSFAYKNRNLSWANIYETAMAPYLAVSAVMELLFSLRMKFNVTPKGQSREKRIFSFKVALPHILLAAASMAGLVLGVHKIYTDAAYMIPVYVLNIFWVLYNLWSLVLNIFVCFEKPRLRSSERLFVKAPIQAYDGTGILYSAVTLDMSETGCGMVIHASEEDFLNIGGHLSVLLDKDALPILGSIVRKDARRRFIALRFTDLSAEQYRHVIRFIFDRQESGYGSFKRSHADSAEQPWASLFSLRRGVLGFKKKQVDAVASSLEEHLTRQGAAYEAQLQKANDEKARLIKELEHVQKEYLETMASVMTDKRRAAELEDQLKKEKQQALWLEKEIRRLEQRQRIG